MSTELVVTIDGVRYVPEGSGEEEEEWPRGRIVKIVRGVDRNPHIGHYGIIRGSDSSRSTLLAIAIPSGGGHDCDGLLLPFEKGWWIEQGDLELML